MSIISILTLVFAITMPLSVVPHILRMMKEKCSVGQSIWNPVIGTIGSIVWFLYGIEIFDFLLIFTNCLWILFNFIYFLIILKYRNLHK